MSESGRNNPLLLNFSTILNQNGAFLCPFRLSPEEELMRRM